MISDDMLEMHLEQMADRIDRRFMRDENMTQAEYDRICKHQGRWYEEQCERLPWLREPFGEWEARNPLPEAVAETA